MEKNSPKSRIIQFWIAVVLLTPFFRVMNHFEKVMKAEFPPRKKMHINKNFLHTFAKDSLRCRNSDFKAVGQWKIILA